jgi:L-ascorbate metabolism protein UlaG (beta-lactamase superfamily)
MQFKNISIEWKGHASFLIVGEGKSIYIDPYKLPPGAKRADIILITHSHYDHCSVEDLKRIVKDGTLVLIPADCSSKLTKLSEKLDVKVIEPGQELEAGGIKVKAVPAYNTNKDFHQKNEYWNGYIINVSGVKVYHAGDTDLIPEMNTLGDVDIALLPVGGTYTMDAEEAARAASVIKPELAIPMHYGEVVGSREDAERFVELCSEQGIKAQILTIS